MQSCAQSRVQSLNHTKEKNWGVRRKTSAKIKELWSFSSAWRGKPSREKTREESPPIIIEGLKSSPKAPEFSRLSRKVTATPLPLTTLDVFEVIE